MILPVGIPPSLCNTALGVVLITGSADLRPIRTALSIILHMSVVGDVTISLTTERLGTGHQTSAPYVAIGTIQMSIALNNAAGAAAR